MQQAVAQFHQEQAIQGLPPICPEKVQVAIQKAATASDDTEKK